MPIFAGQTLCITYEYHNLVLLVLTIFTNPYLEDDNDSSADISAVGAGSIHRAKVGRYQHLPWNYLY